MDECHQVLIHWAFGKSINLVVLLGSLGVLWCSSIREDAQMLAI